MATVCDAHLRWNFILLDCSLPPDHTGSHEGKRDQAVVKWEEGDRRNYRGADPGPCDAEGCVLPLGHHGDHAF